MALTIMNKQVFVVQELSGHSCRVRAHGQGSKVRWNQTFGSRMFEAAIMWYKGTLVFRLAVVVCSRWN